MPIRIIVFALVICLWLLLTFVTRFVVNDEVALVSFVLGLTVWIMFAVVKFDYLQGAKW